MDSSANFAYMFCSCVGVFAFARAVIYWGSFTCSVCTDPSLSVMMAAFTTVCVKSDTIVNVVRAGYGVSLVIPRSKIRLMVATSCLSDWFFLGGMVPR